MTSKKPRQWYKWLNLAEGWYNTNFRTSLQLAPFEALYGYNPPHLGIPQEQPIRDLEVDQYLADRKLVLQLLKDKT